MSLTVVILAAGQGRRIQSNNKSKVLQMLAGKPLIRHVVETVENLKADNTIIIYGHFGDQIKEELVEKDITWIRQEQCLGTGHAVSLALPHINDKDKVLILYGDVPLVSDETLNYLISVTHLDDLGILTANVDNPYGLGRIIRNDFGEIDCVIEHRDASEIQKQIKEINTGIYCLFAKNLKEWVPKINNNNAQKEYYLTDVVAFAKQKNFNIHAAHPVNDFEILGVNTREQLAKLERIWQTVIAKKIMDKGVSLSDPSRFDVRGTLKVEPDTWIDVNVLIEGKVEIGANCTIGANCILKNCSIGDNVNIKPNTMIDRAIVQEGSSVGPFARVRPKTKIGKNVRIGNFVELKESVIGNQSKINHLSYIGDCVIGENSNIGAGVITCNYDGAKKHKTIIGSNVFVGSNCQLIAPISVKNNSTIAAGSTISKNVSEGGLTVNRPDNQRFISNWKRPLK